MCKDVIIACDFSSKKEVLDFLDKFRDKKPYIKIGQELFYSEGASIIKEIKSRGLKIFLDLKQHDIPNTIYKSIKNLAMLDVDMLNVHASGTTPMMLAAKKGVDEINKDIILLAVTQLTSTSEEIMQRDLLINYSLNDTVIHYAKNAKIAGLKGVVCSPLEVSLIKKHCGDDFICVTPGIRIDNKKDDQIRVTTPKMAKELGSDFIVVGRSITNSNDPLDTYNRCLDDFLGE
ncbi:orotidine-5'-phosphate decarboxylase [Campylobacter blaseri]|uniref:Orotidine 5'-phosphate decarboxylase n=1 Tax=Campylobacter blaseri TaxID=2042961 RepID=A0A2P8QZV0_9BACT|nr:orotidine-5'-phosphate decarboxylase [Campylobacter blaseri]PSM51774.1 orotidine-5'-phosphate decarboxylase [Campylobacter blaseri]PSM53565.1 orotidine-5'-phosphate decarboxylase [Campylobacter blaseri]QKF86374.1 orotidine-5'-phosphate decarboxylase [Campylobacter blaseri]